MRYAILIIVLLTGCARRGQVQGDTMERPGPVHYGVPVICSTSGCYPMGEP